MFLNSVKSGKRELGSSNSHVAEILHFLSDMTLAKIEHCKRSWVQAADYFSTVLSDGSYIWVPLEVCSDHILLDVQSKRYQLLNFSYLDF